MKDSHMKIGDKMFIFVVLSMFQNISVIQGGVRYKPIGQQCARGVSNSPPCFKIKLRVSKSSESNKYSFEDRTYVAGQKLGLTKGTYIFYNIPTTHPFGFVIPQEEENKFKIVNYTERTNKNNIYYYTDSVTVIVSNAFTDISYKCSEHGYMGGENSIKYVVPSSKCYEEKKLYYTAECNDFSTDDTQYPITPGANIGIPHNIGSNVKLPIVLNKENAFELNIKSGDNKGLGIVWNKENAFELNITSGDNKGIYHSNCYTDSVGSTDYDNTDLKKWNIKLKKMARNLNTPPIKILNTSCSDIHVDNCNKDMCTLIFLFMGSAENSSSIERDVEEIMHLYLKVVTYALPNYFEYFNASVLDFNSSNTNQTVRFKMKYKCNTLKNEKQPNCTDIGLISSGNEHNITECEYGICSDALICVPLQCEMNHYGDSCTKCPDDEYSFKTGLESKKQNGVCTKLPTRDKSLCRKVIDQKIINTENCDLNMAERKLFHDIIDIDCIENDNKLLIKYDNYDGDNNKWMSSFEKLLTRLTGKTVIVRRCCSSVYIRDKPQLIRYSCETCVSAERDEHKSIDNTVLQFSVEAPEVSIYIDKDENLVKPPNSSRTHSCNRGMEYSLQELNSNCLMCAIGTYKTTRGTQKCLSCPDYSTTMSNGSVSVNNCTCFTGYQNLHNNCQYTTNDFVIATLNSAEFIKLLKLTFGNSTIMNVTTNQNAKIIFTITINTQKNNTDIQIKKSLLHLLIPELNVNQTRITIELTNQSEDGSRRLLTTTRKVHATVTVKSPPTTPTANVLINTHTNLAVKVLINTPTTPNTTTENKGVFRRNILVVVVIMLVLFCVFSWFDCNIARNKSKLPVHASKTSKYYGYAPPQ
jgi:hypothetical protein